MSENTRNVDFNPRSPCGERQGMVVLMRAFTGISIHAPRAGSDENALKNWSTLSSFQSTLPVRGATSKEDKQKMETTISIHAPRAGSDLTGMSDPEKWIRFQSTLPVRGATSFSRAAFAGSCYFNPRSPCGDRRGAGRRIRGNRLISIHAPRAGSDDEPRAGRGVPRDFNPRSPCGERREFGQYATAASQQISIHAPRAGSDYAAGDYRYNAPGFQSTLPVRGATGINLTAGRWELFQSTLPVRGATICPCRQ